MVATETFVGQPVLRKEDGDLLTGQARFIDNFTMPGMLWMAMVRPPYVHATINSVDTSAAASMPGVIGVYTGKDLSHGSVISGNSAKNHSTPANPATRYAVGIASRAKAPYVSTHMIR